MTIATRGSQDAFRPRVPGELARRSGESASKLAGCTEVPKLLFVSLLASVIPLIASAAAQPAEPLTKLAQVSSWQVSAGGERCLDLSQQDDLLHLSFDAAKSNDVRLLLRDPVKIPDWATDFSFLGSFSVVPSKLAIDVILRDADDTEFYYLTKQPYSNSYHGDIDLVLTGQLLGKTRRFSLPGLVRFDTSSNRTVQPLTPKSRPHGALRIIGLRLRGDREPQHPNVRTEILLRGFAITNFTPGTSSFAYQFNDMEAYGEIDGPPALTLADLTAKAGAISFSWEIRGAYAGQPFAAGGDDLTIRTGPDGHPLPQDLARRLEFPIREEGTYWVRVRSRMTPPKGDPELRETEHRLFIIHGAAPISREPLGPSVRLRNVCLRVAPQRQSLIFAPDESVIVPIEMYRPVSPAAGEVAVDLAVTTANLHTPCAQATVHPVWAAGDAPFTHELRLEALAPGAYRVQATMTAGDVVIDRIDRVIGKQSPPPAENAQTRPDAGGAESQESQFSSDRSFFHLSPMIHSAAATRTDKTRWDFFRDFMGQAGEVSKDMEYSVPWSVLEPLPGVFDWEESDRVMDGAARKGLSVVFWPVIASAPEWMPSHFARSKDGRIFYDFAYTYHGGRLNFSQSPELRADIAGMMNAVAARYQSHRAMQGYFFILELPGDAPFMGWLEGYDDFTRANFIALMRARLGTIEKANGRWATRYAGWSDVKPPGESDSDAYWMDWMTFRAGAYDGVIEDSVLAIRRADARHLVWVYGDLTGSTLTYPKLRELGCAVANGGSHDAMHPFDVTQIGLNGLVQRTEDHLPGKWTGYFPTVLDASLFAMSFGGGKAMNCKAYMFTWIPGQPEPLNFDRLRQPPYSLDRYEKFMPIWSELRATETMPIDVRVLLDKAAFLTRSRSSFSGGYWDGYAQLLCYQSHLTFGAAGVETATGGKLLLLNKDYLDYLPKATIDTIVSYVQGGGAVLMRADAGRKEIESPGEDWALLRHFGFDAPYDQGRPGSAIAKPLPAGEMFPPGAGDFALQQPWLIKPQSGVTVAARYRDGSPAISIRRVGRGKVAVVWAQSLIPPDSGPPGTAYPFVRDAARWAGASLNVDADTPRLWVNLLHNPTNGTFYGLTHAGVWAGKPDQPVTGSVRYLTLPDGTYRVSEMISGRDVGTYTSQQLRTTGIRLTLAPREVAVYRISPAAPADHVSAAPGK